MSTEGNAKEDETLKKRSLDSTLETMMLPSLYRLTDGLPRRELKLMITEAKSCEEALEREIRQLEQGLDEKNSSQIKEQQSFIDMVLESDVTPADSFFTVSALVGRLREELAVPLPPNSTLPDHRAQVGLTLPPTKKKKTNDSPNSQAQPLSETVIKQQKLLALEQNPEYTKEHATPSALLALWKKISNHKTSVVFRRPVNPKDAPGYTEKVYFPMDLNLIRKKIAARMIKSYAELHQHIGLIAHNCMKYNGRESDYGVVTRDFEANADEFIQQTVASVSAVAASSDASRRDQSTDDEKPKDENEEKEGPAGNAPSSVPVKSEPASSFNAKPSNDSKAGSSKDSEEKPKKGSDETAGAKEQGGIGE